MSMCLARAYLPAANTAAPRGYARPPGPEHTPRFFFCIPRVTQFIFVHYPCAVKTSCTPLDAKILHTRPVSLDFIQSLIELHPRFAHLRALRDLTPKKGIP